EKAGGAGHVDGGRKKTQWEEDKFRFPPYQYQTCHQVGREDVHRLVNAEEREVILRFPRHYTVNCLPKSKQGSTEHQDLRLTLLGNSWNVTVITWLLSQLGAWLGVSPQLTVQHCIERTSPGANTDFATFLTRQPMNGPRKALIQGGSDLLVKNFSGLFLTNVYYWSTNQVIVQRALAARSLADGQKGVLFAASM
ncbi:unnamed protein product, partial [Cladocopium goreaui]